MIYLMSMLQLITLCYIKILRLFDEVEQRRRRRRSTRTDSVDVFIYLFFPINRNRSTKCGRAFRIFAECFLKSIQKEQSLNCQHNGTSMSYVDSKNKALLTYFVTKIKSKFSPEHRP
uniref:Uncharacterized protein n=1 Tax=Cacopsylla melanoneura TaxID=428564 RepID=A0A8D8ZCM3_9HEMI